MPASRPPETVPSGTAPAEHALHAAAGPTVCNPGRCTGPSLAHIAFPICNSWTLHLCPHTPSKDGEVRACAPSWALPEGRMKHTGMTQEEDRAKVWFGFSKLHRHPVIIYSPWNVRVKRERFICS